MALLASQSTRSINAYPPDDVSADRYSYIDIHTNTYAKTDCCRYASGHTDGDASDAADCDAFEHANVNTTARCGHQYAGAGTGDADGGMYGRPRLGRRRLRLPTGQARLDRQSVYPQRGEGRRRW